MEQLTSHWANFELNIIWVIMYLLIWFRWLNPSPYQTELTTYEKHVGFEKAIRDHIY